MASKLVHLFATIGAISAITLVGCSNKKAEDAVALRKTMLKKVGQAYLSFSKEKQRSPSNIEELAAFIDQASDDPKPTAPAQRLREGDIIMHWNSSLESAKGNESRFVLGFEPSVLQTGGYIITVEGNVVLVTGKTFIQYKTPQKAVSEKPAA